MYYWTRNPHVLFWVAVIILGVGVVLGHQMQEKDGKSRLAELIERIRKEASDNALGEGEFGEVELGPELLKMEPNFDRVLVALEQRPQERTAASVDVTDALQASKLGAAEKSVALAYWGSLCSGAR